ncbi:MAG: SAM-dependent methyltransferase [Actinomycetota bacterium]|nr:SAM-dependent methyltransferase [Actinomycetota bacterium]
MSDRVREAVLAAIRDHGPISFAEYMEMALYGRGGFYESEHPIGEGGHFVTSPHVHPVFGSLLGRAIRSFWEALDRPPQLSIVEVGAGDGTLARHLLAALADMAVEYTAVERSSGARAQLVGLPVHVASGPEMVKQNVTGCVLAHELFDNLPFHRVRGTEHGPVEVCVGVGAGGLVEVEVSCDTTLFEGFPEPHLRPGQETVIQGTALRMLERIARFLGTGYVLLIDYAWRDGATPPHGYRDHRVVEDVLRDPGSADITTGVVFDALERRAGDLGLQVLGQVSQRSALTSLGFGAWSERGRRTQVDALTRLAGREAVRAWSERNEAALLTDPAGLGQLRWLVLATASLPQPPWLRAASELEP